MDKKEPKNPDYTPFDGLLKHLSDQFAPELLSYLGGIENLKECKSVGGEIDLIHRLSDRVWKITEETPQGELNYLLHLEFESSPSSDIGERIGMYGWGIFQKKELPVRHIVWYVGVLKPKDWPEDTWYQFAHKEMKVGEEVESWVRWKEIWLPGKYSAVQFLDEAPPYLLPFAALMRGADSSLIGRLHQVISEAELPESQRQDLLAIAAFFLCRHFDMSEIKEIFDMETIEKNPLGEYLLNKGFEKGIEQGIEQGIEKGQKRTQIKLAQNLLKDGVEAQKVSDLTELSLSEVELLKEELEI